MSLTIRGKSVIYRKKVKNKPKKYFLVISDLLSDDIESRTQVLNTLLDELNEQKTVYDNSMLKLETLSVELVRTEFLI